MNHASEFAAAAAVVMAAVGGALAMLPQPKLAHETSDAQRVEELQMQLRDIAAEHKRLARVVKALAERETEPKPQAPRAGGRK